MKMPTLSDSDLAILASTDGWITDSIIMAVQVLLKKQSDGRVFGWQSKERICSSLCHKMCLLFKYCM